MPPPDGPFVAVSFGRARFGTRAVEGLGAHVEGDAEVWFLPLENMNAERDGGAWIRVRSADYEALAGPVDERIVTAEGSQSRHYEISIIKPEPGSAE